MGPFDGGGERVRALGRRDALRDAYHFLLVSPWPALLLLLIVVYAVVNALFALAYLAGSDSIGGARPGSFGDAFFFSVQTMATIGYGDVVPRTWWARALVIVESLTSLLGLAVVTGLVFAKFSRPTPRVLFSRVMVASQRDGVPSLMFRMANQRSNRIVEAHVHVILVRNETTAEGEPVRRLHDLALTRSEHALFILTWTAIHPIVPGSPLYGVSAEALAASEAEIIVSLTGHDESFAQTVHARHAYSAKEIVWGARFVDILRQRPDGSRVIDYAHFHDVVPVQAMDQRH